ncbi:MAG: glycosyltransferase [Kiritimatiellae bacterium]|nr:glycosyltransferase [Kiritimatiellia bacterium]MCO5069111.1 glycosyltransferase [Kiritimatiellia bacterium]
MAEALFWISLAGLFYIYVGYPALVLLRARLFPKPVQKAPHRASVSVLISVYGEVAPLEAKLRSLFAAAGAEQIREVLVGGDGPQPGLRDGVARIGDARVRVVEFPERRGKPSVLNDLMRECSGEIVVLTDARQTISGGALVALLENFSDPTVGVVSGELIFVSEPGATSAARGIGAYWRYEKLIRRSESAFGSVPGATGALYAIRRELLEAIPPETLLDDVAIPMRAIQRGYRCVFESRAEVYDTPSSDARKESLRKRRTIAGNAQLVRQWPWILNPARNPAWFAFLSHKLARLLSPFLLILAWIANLLLLEQPLYWVLGAGQLLLVLMGVCGWLLGLIHMRAGPLGIPMMFLALNLSTLLALWDAATGRFNVRWARG